MRRLQSRATSRLLRGSRGAHHLLGVSAAAPALSTVLRPGFPMHQHGQDPDRAVVRQSTGQESRMADLAYVSQVRVERREDRVRLAYLPGDEEPTLYGMHGAIAEHYGAQPGQYENHASTIDHLVGAALG
jgi:hypothetical protein